MGQDSCSSSVHGGGARLFAFGADAFRLSAYLESLATDPQAVVRGATGELRLDGFGNVLRDSDWAVFSGGRTRPRLHRHRPGALCLAK